MEFIKEQKIIFNNFIYEMVNRRGELTNLPCNIWIDESSSFKNQSHGPRIRFQNDHNIITIHSNNSIEMEINGNLVDLPSNLELSNKDINQVRNYLYNNKYPILAVEYQVIDFDDYVNYIEIKGGVQCSELTKKSYINSTNFLINTKLIKYNYNLEYVTHLQEFLKYVNDHNIYNESDIEIKLTK